MDLYKSERQRAKKERAEMNKQVQLDRRKEIEFDQVTEHLAKQAAVPKDDIAESILASGRLNREYQAELSTQPAIGGYVDNEAESREIRAKRTADADSKLVADNELDARIKARSENPDVADPDEPMDPDSKVAEALTHSRNYRSQLFRD